MATKEKKKTTVKVEFKVILASDPKLPFRVIKVRGTLVFVKKNYVFFFPSVSSRRTRFVPSCLIFIFVLCVVNNVRNDESMYPAQGYRASVETTGH